MAEEIKHPRRILALGGPASGTLDLLQNLTGTAPKSHDDGSTAGLTHEWRACTPYYTATVPVWVEEVPDAGAWKAEFLKPEAKEVVEAVGGWVYCFRHAANGTVDETRRVEETMKAVAEVAEAHKGYGDEGVMLAVRMPPLSGSSGSEGVGKEDWEDLCIGCGFEYVDFAATGKNEFGEKTGLERVKEALEANEWADDAGQDGLEDGLLEGFGAEGEDEDGVAGFGRDEAEMTAELFGMKAALGGNDDYEDDDGLGMPGIGEREAEKENVENLDRLMGKLLAIKENSADLPEAQKKRMAAKAVRELMRDEA